MKTLLLSVGLFALSSCCCRTPTSPTPAPDVPNVPEVTPQPQTTDRSLPGHPGVVVMNAQETCISIGDVNGVGVDTDLAIGTQVLIIIPGETKNVIVEATVKGPCADDGSGARRHLLDIPYEEPFVGIGIVGRPTVHIPPDQRITADVDGDGTPEVFKACASSEGVHLTIWSGGERRWHGYHYLGYDTEPTCSEREARP